MLGISVLSGVNVYCNSYADLCLSYRQLLVLTSYLRPCIWKIELFDCNYGACVEEYASAAESRVVEPINRLWFLFPFFSSFILIALRRHMHSFIDIDE